VSQGFRTTIAGYAALFRPGCRRGERPAGGRALRITGESQYQTADLRVGRANPLPATSLASFELASGRRARGALIGACDLGPSGTRLPRRAVETCRAIRRRNLQGDRLGLHLEAVTSNRRASSVAVLVTSYLAGAVPFAQIVARLRSTTDLRMHGVGTVSASGLKDVAGVGPAIVAGVLDVAKGTVGPLLAGTQRRPTLATIAGAAAVTGHNWSPFLRWAGGRGISPAMGALLVVSPEGAAVLLAGVAAGRALGESALGALAAYTALAPALARTRGHAGRITAAAVLVPIVVKRLVGNRRATAPRTYVWRLLLDRDQCGKP